MINNGCTNPFENINIARVLAGFYFMFTSIRFHKKFEIVNNIGDQHYSSHIWPVTLIGGEN
jgi:hypothetical protein